MSAMYYERERYERERGFLSIVPEPDLVPFAARIQKAKTHKDKDYFICRVTVPKKVIEKIDAQPGDYLFFKAKKAEWFHLLDWNTMETTWQILPQEVRNQVVLAGLPYPGSLDHIAADIDFERLGATNPSASPRQLPLARASSDL